MKMSGNRVEMGKCLKYLPRKLSINQIWVRKSTTKRPKKQENNRRSNMDTCTAVRTKKITFFTVNFRALYGWKSPVFHCFHKVYLLYLSFKRNFSAGSVYLFIYTIKFEIRDTDGRVTFTTPSCVFFSCDVANFLMTRNNPMRNAVFLHPRKLEVELKIFFNIYFLIILVSL